MRHVCNTVAVLSIQTNTACEFYSMNAVASLGREVASTIRPKLPRPSLGIYQMHAIVYDRLAGMNQMLNIYSEPTNEFFVSTVSSRLIPFASTGLTDSTILVISMKYPRITSHRIEIYCR
jgi:hypothetical protein